MQTVLLTGKGRSGTTWIGHILHTYVHAAYKYEPFLRGKSSPWQVFRDDLQRLPTQMLRHRYDALARRAVHGVDVPPFPPSSVRHQNPRALRLLYAAGERVPRLRFLFEAYARPHMHPDASVLIKDVNFPNELLPRLCEVVLPWLVAVVRNPFANIASLLKGVELGHFEDAGPQDRARVRELIERLGPSNDLRAYLPHLQRLSWLRFEAVRWRVQVEPLVEFVRQHAPARLVVYEDFCRDPIGQTEALFEFLGWRVGAQTRDYVHETIAGARIERSNERAYYSVFRDPARSMNKWRTELTAAQQAEIASVVEDSPVLGMWSDLPIPDARSALG